MTISNFKGYLKFKGAKDTFRKGHFYFRELGPLRTR